MIIIDSNALVVLIVGLVDDRLISKHKRTSLYTKKDFLDLLDVIGDFKKLLVLPNIWTEVDNLLNSFSGDYKWKYIQSIKTSIQQTTEKYIESKKVIQNHFFWNLGLTDSLILEAGKECELIITADSRLSDYAIAQGIPVYDMVKKRNVDLLK
jgi:rRNA-processing protein FCF1